MSLCPARLDPVFSPRPWGSLSLEPCFPGIYHEPIGEAWMTGADCRFADGPFAGQKLADAWPAMPQQWRGTQASYDPYFPLLVKFIFPQSKLSVQVHPDDDYASRHEQSAGGRGKTEMWYAIRATPGAEVLVGLRPDVTREKFRNAITEGTAEDCLQHVPVSSGDAIFVPAGTAHTIGPGLVLCEIQEYSDLTYRVFDYNRRDSAGRARELHIDKALEVIRFGRQLGGKVDPARIARGTLTETHYAACQYFSAEKWEFTEPVEAASDSEHFDLLIFLAGSGSIRWGAQETAYGPSQVWMIPAALGDYTLSPDRSASARTELLRTFVPGDLSRFAAQLRARGLSDAELSRLINP